MTQLERETGDAYNAAEYAYREALGALVANWEPRHAELSAAAYAAGKRVEETRAAFVAALEAKAVSVPAFIASLNR